MKRHIRSIGSASILALAAAAISATPANAATCYDWNDDTTPVINSITVSPSSVELSPGLSSLVTVAINVTDPLVLADCDYDGIRNDPHRSGVWMVQTNIDLMTAPSGGWMTSDIESAVLVSGSIYEGVWEARYYLTDSYSLGDWSVDVSVVDNGINENEKPDSGTFSTTKPATIAPSPSPSAPPSSPMPSASPKTVTSLSLDATPEPAKKGRAITTKARLRAASGPMAATVVRFYFRDKGGSTWRYRGKDVTNTKGIASRGFTARRTGDWEARYAGSASYYADSAIDRVRVTR